MNADGSISGEEYLNLANRAHLDWKRRQATEPDCSTFHNRPERQIDKKNDPLIGLMAMCVADEKHESKVFTNRRWPDFSHGHYDCDITIPQPHKLPQRQRFMRLGPFPDNISPPMMLQQDTGEYPTVQDHAAGRSPAFTFTINDFGHFVYYRASEADGVPTRVGPSL